MSQMSSKHLPLLPLSKGLLMSQFKSPKQIMLSLCEVALFYRLSMSEVKETFSTEGGLYSAISANRV